MKFSAPLRAGCFRTVLAAAAGLLVLKGASGQPTVISAETGSSKKNFAYKIALTDKLGVSVVGEEELTAVSRVDSKGFVNLKFLGEVNVFGLTISEAQKKVEAAYRDGRFLKAPQVTITIEDYAPRPVTITGQVKNQGRYSMPPEAAITVRDLVSMAGGFTDSAKGTEVKITRVYPDGSKKVFEVDVESLMKGRDKAKAGDSDFILEPNDLVFVPERII
ncbi:MAG TPA: polysaccharide biosynthesis/export family protein [Opitutaceae bacterium]|nr:polysaccharide biosynthesis/export family protein [Opitutaceae bacterium]